jgi:hypothetical protein
MCILGGVREGSRLIGCVFTSSQAISARIEVEVERLVVFMKAMDHAQDSTAIEMVSKVDTPCIFVLFAVALAAAGVIRSQ